MVLEGLDHVLMATGRKPNTRGLGLEEARPPVFSCVYFWLQGRALPPAALPMSNVVPAGFCQAAPFRGLIPVEQGLPDVKGMSC